MDLTTDNLKLEDELERTINFDQEIVFKLEKIKTILSKMVAIDSSIVKFTSMMNNNNEVKQKEDDKI